MRKSVISSSVTTIVASAIDCLVAAGLTVRTHLRHTSMREHQGNGYEPNNGNPMQCDRLDRSPLNPLDSRQRGRGKSASLWQGLFLKRPTQQAFALCPAYAAIARVAHKG